MDFYDYARQRPERLFRYFGPANVNLFTSARMWVSVATDFNDVFETAPRYDTMIESGYSKGFKRSYAELPEDVRAVASFEQYVEAMLTNLQPQIISALHNKPAEFQRAASLRYGIICFCGKVDCSLMWGHYTRNHTGFVVEFVPSHSMFAPGKLAKVYYHEERPTVDMDQDDERIFLQKSPAWEYEDEYRLVMELDNLPRALRGKDDTESRAYLDLDFNAVKAVYFGLNMREQDRTAILSALKLERLKNIEPFIMRRHRTRFEVVPVPWRDASPSPTGTVKSFADLWDKFKV
jgi:hypothetical protein